MTINASQWSSPAGTTNYAYIRRCPDYESHSDDDNVDDIVNDTPAAVPELLPLRISNVTQPALPAEGRSPSTTVEGTIPRTTGAVSHDPSSTANGETEEMPGLTEGFLRDSDDDQDDEYDDMPELIPRRPERQLQINTPKFYDTSVTVNGNDASVEGSTTSESSTPLSTTIRRIRGNNIGQPALPSDERSPRTIAEGTSPSTIGEVSHDTSITINEHDASVNGSTTSTFNRRIRTNGKRLIVGTRVSGPHGDLAPNPKGGTAGEFVIGLLGLL